MVAIDVMYKPIALLHVENLIHIEAIFYGHVLRKWNTKIITQQTKKTKTGKGNLILYEILL